MGVDPRGRKTKIVVTIGPASSDRETIQELLQAGMNVVRINTSHADKQTVTDTVQLLRIVSAEMNIHLGILLDLSGPKIRVDNIPLEGIPLSEGEVFTLGYDKEVDIRVRPNVKFQSVDENARVMLDDGRIELKVLERLSSSALKAQVVYGGLVKPNKGVNFPGVALGVPSLTTRDMDHLRHGLDQDIDWVALSFVRSPEDRKLIDEIFAEVGKSCAVMAKIEKPEAVKALDEVIEKFDGIMVARGDLGVEMPLDEVPLIQKEIIRKCNRAGKPVVTATQLLDSMVSSPAPTRAEVNDVANAIFDGTDALMLSNETAVGSYPVKAVQTLDRIARTIESATIGQTLSWQENHDEKELSHSISHAACTIARECDVPVIVSMTHSGFTARGVSQFRPKSCIVALSPMISTCRQLQLSWGVIPLEIVQHPSTTEMIKSAERLLVKKGFVKKGDTFVFTAGVPVGIAGTTNLIKVQEVGGTASH